MKNKIILFAGSFLAALAINCRATVFSDLYLENRTPDIIKTMWDQAATVEEKTTNFLPGERKKIGAFALPNQKIDQANPQGTLFLFVDGIGYLALVQCYGSSFWSNGAGARLDGNPQFYTERDSAVAGISTVSKDYDTKKGRIRVWLQAYPYGGKTDVNIIMEKI